jgi:hypothetical protein
VGRRPTRRAAARRLAALVAAIALAAALAGCTYTVVVTPTPLGSFDRPIAPTPWPNGTVGACGLRISPSLLYGLPTTVGGSPLVEDTLLEVQAMDDSAFCSAFTAYYATQIGDLTDANWLVATFEQPKEDAQNQDFYDQWRDSWFKTACSQADGLDTTASETINDWRVDVGHCKGGVDAYVVALDSGLLISAMDLGPRRLGRELIQAIK